MLLTRLGRQDARTTQILGVEVQDAISPKIHASPAFRALPETQFISLAA